MTTWQNYTALNNPHTVVGDLRIYPRLYSHLRENHRNILAWLPPFYPQTDKHYPVIYMHDGYNLFDTRTSIAGEWQVDETMQALSSEGFEAIIVGIPSIQNGLFEHNPFAYLKISGKGELYLRFIMEEVKPLIDRSFRVLQEPRFTGIAGSSMGGLISMYGFLTYPDVFGFCGAFSTAYWFGNNGLIDIINQRANGSGKIYLDVGTKEGDVLEKWHIPADNYDHAYVEGVRQLRDALLEKGYYQDSSLLYVEETDANHHENAWARRLPAALRYLLG